MAEPEHIRTILKRIFKKLEGKPKNEETKGKNQKVTSSLTRSF
jgi:hypothetical protein